MSEAAAPSEGAEKKKSKLPLIIIGAVVALGAVGGGVFFMMGKKGDKEDGEHAKEEAHVKAAAVYVKYDPPFVVNVESRGAMRFLQVQLEVMTRDPKTAEMLKTHEPVIRNDLLLLFGNQTGDKLNSREGKEELRKETLAAVSKVITDEGGDAKTVEQLYFTSFVMQ